MQDPVIFGAGDVQRRVAALERQLNGLGMVRIITDNQFGSRQRMKVLGASGAPEPDALSESVTGGPFRGYVADLTAGTEKFAISPGTIVTNIQTGASIEPTGAGAWYNMVANTKAWIECVIAADLTLTSAEIKTGDTWPLDNGVTFVGDTQTRAYVHIGSMKDGSLTDGQDGFNVTLTRNVGTKDFHWDQKIQTNLFLALMVIDGKAAVFPLPFSG